jgi:hypothetical protein
MTPTPPIEKQFGADVGTSSGKELLQKTITGNTYQNMPKSIAQDFNALFAKLEFNNAKLADPMLISRLQGYLGELSVAVGLMAAVLQESGFVIKSTPTFGGAKLSIEKKGGQL